MSLTIFVAAMMLQTGEMASLDCGAEGLADARPCVQQAATRRFRPRVSTRSLRRQGGFPDCAAARRLGAAPVHRNDPGYGAHLDPDGDGIACD